jgi:hypothetical protein
MAHARRGGVATNKERLPATPACRHADETVSRPDDAADACW